MLSPGDAAVNETVMVQALMGLTVYSENQKLNTLLNELHKHSCDKEQKEMFRVQ